MISPLPDIVPYPIKRLNREEFTAALRKGQGRAYLHVRQYGLDDVADLVLEACLHNQVFDIDIEHLRGEWLFSMFWDTPHLPKFRDGILKALGSETKRRDLMQLCELGAYIAASGDDEMRRALREVVFRFASDPQQDWSIGAGDWLELTGPIGMLELARVYGQRLLADADDNVYAALPFTVNDPAFMAILREYGDKDLAIHTYLEYVEAKQKRLESVQPIDREIARNQTHRKIRKEYKLDEILEGAKRSSKNRYHRGVVFGKHATQKELEKVYAELLKETDEAVQMRLLWVFRRAKLPELNDKLFYWATAAGNDLRFAAIAALSQVTDERVHQLAREKARTGALLGADHEALGLFLKNYETGDAKRIIESLKPLSPDSEDADGLVGQLA